MPVNIPFAQYNVLSSSLCEPTWYTESPAQDLPGEVRLPRVLAKLQAQIDASNGRVIIALQEVSMLWLGPLDAWFSERGYKFVCSLYGNQKNDYMGVALAAPLAAYDVLQVAVSCPATAQSWGRAPNPGRPGDWLCPSCGANCFASRDTCFKCKTPKPSDLGDKLKAALEQLRALLLLVIGAVTLSALWLPAARWVLELLGLYTPPKPKRFGRPKKTPFEQAQDKFNRLIYFRLRPRQGAGEEFGVATYHMPCVFWEPSVMVIHAALCAQRTRTLAAGAPHVLLGDFNFKPGDAAYRLVTEGALDDLDPAYPEPPDWEPWRPELEAPMTSAYAALGGEPAFTNHTVSGMNPAPFTDTLDYIFYSEGFAALSALPTPPSSPLIERCKAPQPGLSGPPSGEPPAPVGELSAELAAAGVPFCPNAQEPSDHILIAAELQLGAPAARRQAKPKATSRRKSRAKSRAKSPSASPPPASGLRRSSRLR